MKLDDVQINMDHYVENAEVVKEAVLDALVKEDFLTLEAANNFADNYVVVTIKIAWYKRWYKKTFSKDAKREGAQWKFRVVKL